MVDRSKEATFVEIFSPLIFGLVLSVIITLVGKMLF